MGAGAKCTMSDVGVAAQLNQLVMQERLKAATALLGELAAARDGFNTLDLQIFEGNVIIS